ncbi:type II toxin-antitoxin system PemK/MazF family toxin [Oceanobacillus timonensis]|uniref:type II toxin-antitoxin system PemK/MazF family toxin n=1 Tax=Oceanobacillus timonensis TaxID=1926285 RepID=UPI0009BA3DF2|nr:type II toxin-antitoxin system PemK/MazF family toxin [Oceanobacillus timonensis]
MKPGYIYDLTYSYEDEKGQGKNRPVLILFIQEEDGTVQGLKITGTKREQNRVPIKKSPNSGLTKQSYVQIDCSENFEYDESIKPRGMLDPLEFLEIVEKFNNYQK